MDHVVELLDQIIKGLGDVARSDVVVGKPIAAGRTTIIPLCRVRVGYGAGGGVGEGEFDGGPDQGKGESGKGRGSGGAAGGGGRVRPVAVVVFSDDGVKVHPIPDRKGLLDKLFEKVPELIEMAKKAQER
jgi:uncharacterized spore protein YtfJ